MQTATNKDISEVELVFCIARDLKKMFMLSCKIRYNGLNEIKLLMSEIKKNKIKF